MKCFKYILFFCLLFQLSALNDAYSQSDSKIRPRWGKRHCFTSLGFSPILYDMAFSSWQPYSEYFIVGGMGWTNVEYKQRLEYMSFLGMNFHPRINLKDYNENFSLSINFPCGIAIGAPGQNRKLLTAIPEPNRYYGDRGFKMNTAFRQSGLICINFGYHSTFNNVSSSGFYLGAGAEYVSIGFLEDPELKASGLKTSWISPAIAMGFKSDRLEYKKGIELIISGGTGWSFRVSGIHTFRY